MDVVNFIVAVTVTTTTHPSTSWPPLVISSDVVSVQSGKKGDVAERRTGTRLNSTRWDSFCDHRHCCCYFRTLRLLVAPPWTDTECWGSRGTADTLDTASWLERGNGTRQSDHMGWIGPFYWAKTFWDIFLTQRSLTGCCSIFAVPELSWGLTARNSIWPKNTQVK